MTALALPAPAVLAITDRRQCAEPLESRAEKLFKGGCRWLSVREKDLTPAARLALLRRLIAIGDAFGARVGVHGDLEAAIACAAPLHLPAGADLSGARRRLGDHAMLGQSCHAEAEIAAAGAADYVTLGPVFPSASKPGYAPNLSAADFSAVVARSTVPVLALGGIDSAALPFLARMPIAGVAVMGEAMRAADPTSWFRRFAAIWEARPSTPRS